MKKTIILMISMLTILVIFLTKTYIEIPEYKYEENHYMIIKESYKYTDLTKKIKIEYNGECEKEIYNRYSKNKQDEELLLNFIETFKNEMTYYTLEENKNNLLDKLIDRDLAKSLKISFIGMDIALFDIYNYKNYCSQIQEQMLKLNIGFYLFLLIYLIVISLLVFINKKKQM